MSNTYNIVIFGGDHCGPEVMVEAKKILKVISESGRGIQFNLQDHLMGGCAIGGPVSRASLLSSCKLTMVEMGNWSCKTGTRNSQDT
jgi:3-isopropylmalate dehydrogenase